MQKTPLLTIPHPIIVEGKNDKARLSSVVDATILTTEGFGVFKSHEKRTFFRTLAQRHKIIVLTDSDGAGLVIRNHLRSIIPPDRLIHLYIPSSSVGTTALGRLPNNSAEVEDAATDTLRNLLEPYANQIIAAPTNAIKKSDLYQLGLSGTENALSRRLILAQKLGLPTNLSANALLEALNLLTTFDELVHILNGE